MSPTFHARTIILAVAATTVIVAGLVLPGCSKSTSPTMPYDTGTTSGSGARNVPFDSGSLTAPAHFVHVFPDTGRVGYHCTFHVSMGMIGVVRIVFGAADSAVVATNGTTFVPADVTVRPGGYVRWNVTGGVHTVTSD